METTANNTTTVNDILNPLYETAKGFCVVKNTDGTPDRDRTIIYLIKSIMNFTYGIALPDMNPITTAVCHYARTSADDRDVRRAVRSLNALQDLMGHLRANLCTLGIFENALDRYDEAKNGEEVVAE